PDFGLLTVLVYEGLTGSARRRLMVPQALVHLKPQREQLRVTIGLTSYLVFCLLPSSWVLSRLESCRKRERRELSSPHPVTRPLLPGHLDHVSCIPGWPSLGSWYSIQSPLLQS
ncbi:cytochrome c oxidase subunit 8A, mitochondrial-like, partial [Meriones unguiculatus]|uniref:cytochrome c oxidase subunit 8A, mitochondrial-like n=1 Tax=Meriones unguiculatus TaxID=10047 RepID=UPI000B4FA563